MNLSIILSSTCSSQSQGFSPLLFLFMLMQNIFIIFGIRHLIGTLLLSPVKSAIIRASQALRQGGQNVTADLNVDKCRTSSDLISIELSRNAPASGLDNEDGFIQYSECWRMSPHECEAKHTNSKWSYINLVNHSSLCRCCLACIYSILRNNIISTSVQPY